MERRAVTKFGLSFSEFWDSTPRELEMLLEQSSYKAESEMNQVRHIMTAIANSVPRKSKTAVKPTDIMKLPLIDGRGLTAEEAKTEQEKANEALKRMKARDARELKKDKNGSN